MYCTAARTWWDLGLHLLSGRHLVILGLGYSCMLAACWLMPCHRATASRLRRSTEDAARPKSITLMGACTHHTSHTLFIFVSLGKHSHFTSPLHHFTSLYRCPNRFGSGSVSFFYLFLSKRSKRFFLKISLAVRLCNPCFGARNSLV